MSAREFFGIGSYFIYSLPNALQESKKLATTGRALSNIGRLVYIFGSNCSGDNIKNFFAGYPIEFQPADLKDFEAVYRKIYDIELPYLLFQGGLKVEDAPYSQKLSWQTDNAFTVLKLIIDSGLHINAITSDTYVRLGLQALLCENKVVIQPQPARIDLVRFRKYTQIHLQLHRLPVAERIAVVNGIEHFLEINVITLPNQSLNTRSMLELSSDQLDLVVELIKTVSPGFVIN